MYSSHQKPTPSDIGALPTTGGTVSGTLSVTGGLTGSLNGNASTATKLQTARSIGGVVFDGSANINLPGVNTTGNQNTTGNAATATKLQTARNINGVPFDGTKDITLTPKDLDAYSKSEVQSALAGKQPLDNTLTNLSGKDVAGLLTYLGLRELGTSGEKIPLLSTANTWSARQTFNGGITGALTGNADTATKLKTAININGVRFDGSADITLTPKDLDVYSKSEIDNKKGMRKYTFSAPANAVSGKWYPIVFRRSGGSTDELASRVVITTYSSAGGYAMNNCEFNGFVMPGGWSDRGSYAAGFFSIYSTAERAIHSIISSVKDDDLCSVFYVEARAFPIKIFAEEGLNVIVPTTDYTVGQATYKWGATDPVAESTNTQTILDFKNGRGYYCSHQFVSSLSGNAATATKLASSINIGGVSFDGSADIDLPGVNTKGNQDTTGNAATATKLQTACTINGVSFDGSKDIELNPRSIGTINSTTMSFSGGAGWFKLATVTMPQASSVVYINLIGGAGYNVGSPQQAGISELVLRAGNGNPKGITGALWRRTSVGFTNFAWVNTSGDTYDIYVEIGNYATGVNIQWDYTKDATVQIHTSPTYTANKPTGLTDGTVYVIYSSHIKPTAAEVGALSLSGGQLNGALGIGTSSALGGNSIVLGDNDTGFKQNGDGNLDVYANNVHVMRFVSGSIQSNKTINITGRVNPSDYGNFDSRYVRDMRLGGASTYKPANNTSTWTHQAPSGCVYTGIIVQDTGSNSADNIGGVYYRPVQKQINGTWYNVAQV
nr:phage tail protein [Escherichia coli]